MNENNKNPNYYGILPAKVRYADINPMSKILYTELTALTNKSGYCHASNSYFAELYKTTKETISRYFSELQQAGFISISIIRNDKKEIIERRIYIVENTNSSIGIDESVNTLLTNPSIPIDESVKENITSINNTSINNIYMCDDEKNEIETNENETEKEIETEKDEFNLIHDEFLEKERLFRLHWKTYKLCKPPNSRHDDFSQYQLARRRAIRNDDKKRIFGDNYIKYLHNFLKSSAEWVKNSDMSFAYFMRKYEAFSEEQHEKQNVSSAKKKLPSTIRPYQAVYMGDK